MEASLWTRDWAKSQKYWMKVIFRWLCINNRQDSVMEITAWAQEHFQRSLPVNTAQRAVYKCRLKLHHTEKKPYVNMVQKPCCFLWTQFHFKWKVENCSVVRLIQISHRGCHILQTKALLWALSWYDGAFVPMELATCTSGKALLSPKGPATGLLSFQMCMGC